MRTRREFLAGTRDLALAVTASSLIPSICRAEAMGLPPGIQLYTVRENLSRNTASTLLELHQIGFREVETAGFGKLSAAEFRRLLDAASLTCSSAHVNLNASALGPVFEEVHALGAQFATSSSLATGNLPRVPPGQPRPAMGLLGLDGFKKLAAQMNEIGAKARTAGLQYAYHNHNYEFEKMPDGRFGYDFLVEGTDHDLVKFEIDCGWMCVAGANPVDYLRKYPGRIKMLHIKEFKPTSKPVTSLFGPDRPQGTDLGQGFIDYKPIFAAAKEAGVAHAFSEQEDPFPVSQIESAKAAYAFLAAYSS